MKHTNADLFNALFAPGDKVNIRVIKDNEPLARNRLYAFPAISLADEYSDGFPCVGINPRLTVQKLSSIKNMVVDIDGAPLPEWAKDKADIICTRDDSHHHLSFCFARPCLDRE